VISAASSQRPHLPNAEEPLATRTSRSTAGVLDPRTKPFRAAGAQQLYSTKPRGPPRASPPALMQSPATRGFVVAAVVGIPRWHARGQGFKSPQLHQAFRIFQHWFGSSAWNRWLEAFGRLVGCGGDQPEPGQVAADGGHRDVGAVVVGEVPGDGVRPGVQACGGELAAELSDRSWGAVSGARTRPRPRRGSGRPGGWPSFG
jgi:hypothetical protein